MGTLSQTVVDQSMHPLDLVEEMISLRDWAVERTGRNELLSEMGGRWCDYHAVFNWVDHIGALQMTCAFDVRTPSERRASAHELLAVLNERLGIGHFDIGAEDGLPAYRHALLLRGGSLSVEQVEDMIDIALHELDRFYPAFQCVIWGSQTVQSAVTSIMFDTVGEA
jgi:hypothetical protein